LLALSSGRALDITRTGTFAGRLYTREEKKFGRGLADETRRPPARHPGNPDWTSIAVTGRSYEVVPMRTAFLEEREAQRA
jgi:hypothetical protein